MQDDAPQTQDVSRSEVLSRRAGWRLAVIAGASPAVHHLSVHRGYVIGRGDDADVRVDHASVSRRHARLNLGPAPSLEDLKSANGTFVDGRPVPGGGAAAVASGSVIELGEAMLVLQAPAQGDVAPGASTAPLSPQVIARVAQSQLAVLLLGETGAGKSELAERLHRESKRANGPLLRLNCSALSESLLESELFGFEKGAFTGATQPKTGLLESATGGTVLLDEIGELPQPMQAKLLQVLERKEVLPVGAVRPRPVDVRFISATNRNLGEMMGLGTFRSDLYFRLAGVTFSLPPLRARRDDLRAFTAAFLQQAAAEAGRPAPTLSVRAIAAMEAYPWPGNLRELRAALERAVVCGGDVIEPHDLQLGGAGPQAPPALAPAAPTDERSRVLSALEACAGNQTRAAKLLGIARSTLVARLDAFGAKRPRKR